MKSGYINKQGQNNVMGLAYWPERFFTMENNIFSYYADDTKKDLKGLYRLGKDDTVELKDGVLSLTSTFFKNDDSFGNGSTQKLNMKFAKKVEMDAWQKTIKTIISYAEASPRYISHCFCRSVECTVVGKCTSEITCHCQDCSHFQGISPVVLFPRGSLFVTKGGEFLQMSKSTKPNTSMLRGFCKQCHTLCFVGMNLFDSVGVPLDRLYDGGATPNLSRSRPKFHINYASKHTVMKDGQRKYSDVPSNYGGSGNILDDDGNFTQNDSLNQKQESTAKKATAPLREDGLKPVALVTGGNRGIGLEVCKQLAETGFRVVLAGRDAAKAEKAAADLRATGAEVEALQMDTSSDASVKTSVEVFAGKYDSLDVLVNNVGDGFDVQTTASTVPMGQARESMDVNLFSAWRVTQAFTPFLKAAPRGARVVMVGSSAGTVSDTASGHGFNNVDTGSISCHGVSKMALHGLTVKLALEFKESGIMVNAACPGATDSAGTGLGRSVSESAAGIVSVAKLAPGGPTGEFFRDGQHINVWYNDCQVSH